MNLREFFLGTKEEQDARCAKNSLETARRERNRKRWKPDEERRYQEAVVMERRYFFRISITAVLCLCGIGGGIRWIFSRQRNDPLQTDDRDDEEPEAESLEFFEDLNKARKTYDEGFAVVLGEIPETPSPKDSLEIKALSKLKEFRKKLVRWAEAQGERIIALEKGSLGGAWLVIFPPGHPAVSPDEPFLAIDPNPTPADMNLLRVQPYRISREWAGIVKVHELSHLMDRAFHIEPKQPNREQFLAGEVRAYFLEIAATNSFTHGIFREALRTTIQNMRWNSIEEIFLSFSAPTIQDVIGPLDETISNSPAESSGERSLRDGFYRIALGFEFIRMKFPAEQQIPLMKDYVAKAMGENRLPRF